MSWLATAAGAVIALLAGMLVMTVNDAMRARLRIRRRLRPITNLLDTEGSSTVTETALPEAQTESDNYIVERLDALFPLSGGLRTGMIMFGTMLLLWILILPAMVFVGVPTIFAVFLSLAAAITFGWNAGSVVESRKRDAYCNRLV